MSVIVRGMEMPRDCSECPHCFITPPEIDELYELFDPADEKSYENGRPKWCPLFELKDWKDL